MNYQDFDLMIEREGDIYRAKVTHSPAGEPSSTFDNPFTELELERFLDLLGHPGQDTQAAKEASRDFGGRLFDAVFDGDVNVCLRVSLDRIGDDGLRIRLHLVDVPELAALPWEYLYNADLGSLSRLSKTPIVRYMDLSRPSRALAIKSPLRILVMISSPAGFPALDVDKEWTKLKKSLKKLIDRGTVELVLLKEATVSALQDQFRSDPPYHVFHFIGHGGYDARSGDGFLILEDREDDDEGMEDNGNRKLRSQRVNGERIADLLRNHASLRLAVINACDGARASLTDPFGGIAQSLVRASIPAVVAMQFPITDDAAISFAAEFYKAMAAYSPVDAALSDARLMMSEAEWGTPALFMRSPDGCIFQKTGSLEYGVFSPNANDLIADEIHCDDIVNAIKEGRLVPFLGPRANLCGHVEGRDWEEAPYAPSDRELAAYLSRSSGMPESAQELVQVSQDIELISSERLLRELHSVLTRNFRATRLHSLLATIPRILRETVKSPEYPLIVTSNYDDVLEQAFNDHNEEYDLVSYIARGKYRGKFSHKPHGGEAVPLTKANEYSALTFDKRAVILKIHGAVDRQQAAGDGFVITEDHYIDYLVKKDFFNLVPSKLTQKLRNDNLLFLGYRLRGWNLRIILRRIWGEESLRSKSWAVEAESDPDDKYWKKRNVEVLNMTLSDFVAEMEKRLDALTDI